MRDLDLGAMLRTRRETRGISQAAVASKIHRTPQQVSHMERAGRRLKVSDVAAYAEAIGERLVVELEPIAGGVSSEIRAVAATLPAEDLDILLRFAKALTRASARDKTLALRLVEEETPEPAATSTVPLRAAES